jgi:hypothetical protein
MKPTVYVETSIFSALVARETTNLIAMARQQVTRIWWQNDAEQYSLFASDIVQMEARLGDPEMARRRLEFVASIPRLSCTVAAERIAEGLLIAGILPAKARTDAIHLGIATIHSLEFVVSWNCKHLANGPIYRRVAQHLAKGGYNAPYVCTPNLLPGVTHG